MPPMITFSVDNLRNWPLWKRVINLELFLNEASRLDKQLEQDGRKIYQLALRVARMWEPNRLNLPDHIASALSTSRLAEDQEPVIKACLQAILTKLEGVIDELAVMAPGYKMGLERHVALCKYCMSNGNYAEAANYLNEGCENVHGHIIALWVHYHLDMKTVYLLRKAPIYSCFKQ